MFAGLSFLTRMLKHFFEKIGVGNLSEGDITSDSFIENEMSNQNNNNEDFDVSKNASAIQV